MSTVSVVTDCTFTAILLIIKVVLYWLQCSSLLLSALHFQVFVRYVVAGVVVVVLIRLVIIVLELVLIPTTRNSCLLRGFFN